MDNQNQNPVTPPIPAVGTPSLQNDLPISEIVSAMKNTPAPEAAPVASAAPVPPVTAPATPAPRSTAVLSPDSQSGAPTPNPLSENPDQVMTPGQ